MKIHFCHRVHEVDELFKARAACFRTVGFRKVEGCGPQESTRPFPGIPFATVRLGFVNVKFLLMRPWKYID